jgi:hypothetical protein
MSHLIYELSLCLAVTILFLIGGAVVLLLTKTVEVFELIAIAGRQRDCQATSAITRCNRLAWLQIGL